MGDREFPRNTRLKSFEGKENTMTFSDAREKYNSYGGHFFDRETMRFWKSRIESTLYKNRCFITSELNFDGSQRLYTVRRFSKDFKEVDTIGEFNCIRHIDTARKIAKGVE